MAMAPDPGSNRLLAALPDAEWRRWLPHLELVSLAVGQVVSEPGQTPSHAYFPATAVVSLLCLSENRPTKWPSSAMKASSGSPCS